MTHDELARHEAEKQAERLAFILFVRSRPDFEPEDLKMDDHGEYARFTTRGAWIGYQLANQENANEIADQAETIAALVGHVRAFVESALFDPMMSGASIHKGWNRSVLDRELKSAQAFLSKLDHAAEGEKE